jgi:hypothetical protein
MPVHADARELDGYLYSLLKDGRATRVQIVLQNGSTEELYEPFVIGKQFIRGSAGDDPSAYRTCIYPFTAIARISPIPE